MKRETITNSATGFTKVYSTQNVYIHGSLVVYINGQLKTKSLEDGWQEKGGKLFELGEYPVAGDIIQVFYRY